MGDLSAPHTGLTKVTACFVGVGIIIFFLFSRELNLLTLGEEKAVHLGANVMIVKKILFLTASLITAGCVAASGIIGFVGLIIPHIMRQLIGGVYQTLIPAVVLGGGTFLSVCDCFARTVIAPIELPVGVITGILGGGFFLVILLRTTKWKSI
jgi:iron complex transport system permease protein